MTGRNTSPERSRSSRSSVVVPAMTAASHDDDDELIDERAPVALARPPRAPSSPEVGKRIALLAAAAGLDKKAEDIQIIDVVGKVDYADYIVLMTGTSDRNVAAIARGIETDLAK